MITNQTAELEQIAAELAHEVKNPLSLVSAGVDLLELNDTHEENAKNYSLMRREIGKINDLLLDFIQFAKPQENNFNEVSLLTMICELIDLLKTAHNKKIEFEIVCRPRSLRKELFNAAENFTIFADSGKIKRVFQNLLKNAVEAVTNKRFDNGEHGKIKVIFLKTRKHIIIKIIDNGIGLDKEQAAMLCRPFFTTKTGGSGLGLYLSKNIISDHGGTLYISGERGKGCKSEVIFPVNFT